MTSVGAALTGSFDPSEDGIGARAGIGPLYGSDDRDPLDVTTNIVQAVKTYFELCPWSTIERVYFLAYTDADDELLTTAFNRPRLNFDRDEAPIPAPASARNA